MKKYYFTVIFQPKFKKKFSNKLFTVLEINTFCSKKKRYGCYYMQYKNLKKYKDNSLLDNKVLALTIIKIRKRALVVPHLLKFFTKL